MKFDHLSVPVADPIAVAEWFCKLFRADVLFKNDEWVFLQTNGTKIAFVNENLHPAHFAMVIEDNEAFCALACDFDAFISTDRADTLSFYIKGPEGVCVEFVHYLESFDV